MRQRVLERVFGLREELRLVDELRSLQVIESATDGFIRQLGDLLEDREGHVFAYDGGGLQETFVLRRETIDARRQHRLDRRGHLDREDRVRQPIPSALPYQQLRLHQGPNGLFQEERVPAVDEELLERCNGKIRAEERVQQLTRAVHGERVQPHLRVVRLIAPGMLVFGTVVREHQ